MDSTADLTPVLHHSAAGKDSGPPDVAALREKMDSPPPETGLPLCKSRALPWYSSVAMGMGGGVSEAHAHFPPQTFFLVLLSAVYRKALLNPAGGGGSRCVREASEAIERIKPWVLQERRNVFSCARDSLMDISNFASNDA